MTIKFLLASTGWFGLLALGIAFAFRSPADWRFLELFRVGCWTLYWGFCALSVILSFTAKSKQYWAAISIASLFGFVGVMGADTFNNGTPGELMLYLTGIEEPPMEPASVNSMRRYYHLTAIADLAIVSAVTVLTALFMRPQGRSPNAG